MRSTMKLVFFILLSPILRAQMIIIANPELKIEHISRADVRDIFTGTAIELTSGMRVKPVLLKPGAAHDEFLSAFIGEKAAQFRQDWMSLLFAGKMLLPPSLGSEAEVVDYVAHHASSIGYIHKTSAHAGVIVLAVP